jgi:AmmeMemoRadiSam system protein B
MKKLLIVFFILILAVMPASAKIKKADLAGAWYSGSKEALSAELHSYLNDARVSKIDGKIIAIISPHAGFQYSGPVAAYGFKAIKRQGVKTVIVVGFSHRRHYDGVALLDEDAFETPLGRVARRP